MKSGGFTIACLLFFFFFFCSEQSELNQKPEKNSTLHFKSCQEYKLHFQQTKKVFSCCLLTQIDISTLKGIMLIFDQHGPRQQCSDVLVLEQLASVLAA